MSNKKIKRIAAALAAASVISAAMPVSSVPAMAAVKTIINSTFDSGVGEWGTYKESGGVCSLKNDDGRLALTVSNVGKVNYAVQVWYDIIPLYQNGVYRLKYDISCTTDRYVEGMIQQNGGTYQAYTWKGLNISSEPLTVDYEFTMKEETDIMAKLVFNCGIQEKDGGALPEHTIFLDNVTLELIDDSKVDYSANRPYEPDINVNQVGYRTDGRKVAVVRNAPNDGTFSVINARTEKVMYEGTLSEKVDYSAADETDWKADFTELKTEGTYYIKCDGLDDSYTFSIGDDVYSELINDSVKMLYLQRCGMEVKDDVVGHPACHDTMATIFGTSEKIDVTGGWHDAGDYGRYTVAAAKAVADVLYAYTSNPEIFTDNIGIPESDNGIPDILDEARYEIEWMRKMQASNGGAYHKVTCESFPGYVAPQKETAPLIVTPVSTTATADLCATMALAYEIYKDIDSEFADECLESAKKAWNYLIENPNFYFKNETSITTGDYGDRTDKDERYWAAAQLYRATGYESCKEYLDNTSALTGLDWSTVGDYGNIALFTMEEIDKTSSLYTNAEKAIMKQADSFASISESTGYGVALTKFNWGSNMTVANAGIISQLAYKNSGLSEYLWTADSQLDYLLGVNPCGTCFVSGFGTVSPESPHHRPSMAANKAMKGMLAGGVDQMLEDSAAKAYCQDLPPAKRYVDNSESYSTNEITIYWNSPLIYLLALSEAKEESQPDKDECIVEVYFYDWNTKEPISGVKALIANQSNRLDEWTSANEVHTSVVPYIEESLYYLAFESLPEEYEFYIPILPWSFEQAGEKHTINYPLVKKSDSSILRGDANCNGRIEISDAVAILQCLANSEKYPLSEQGKKNADVDGVAGVTGNDALKIQKYDAKVIDKL